MLLASPDFLFYSLHLITIIASPLHIFGFYCIIFKTPKAINSVKLTMLNLHVWCLILDWGFTVFAVPFLLFPAMAGFPLGIWTSVFKIPVSIQIYLIMSWIFTTCIGIVLIFENRYYHISGRNRSWRHYRIPFFVLNYFLNVVALIPAMTKIPEQSGAVAHVLNRIPSLPAEIREYPIFVLSIDYFWVLVPFYSMASLLFTESAVFCGLILRNMNTNIPIRSRNTMILQKRFLQAMYSQVAVLFFNFFLPIIYVSFAMLFNYYNQAGNNLMFIVMALHGMSSTVVMLWAHKPYRIVWHGMMRDLKLRVNSLRMMNIPKERRPPRIVISVVF